jgi:hypothetical protein
MTSGVNQTGSGRFMSGRVSRRSLLLIVVVVAVAITGAGFLVTEFVVAPIPGSNGAAGSAVVHGFPIPYSTFFGCCSQVGGPGASVSLDNTYYWNPVSLIADFGIWLAISLGAAYAFTLRRFLVSAASGVGITLATLMLPPLSIVAPTPSSMATLSPMGFPYEYLTYYTVGFGGVSSRGFEFGLGPVIADYALWAGVVLAVTCLSTVVLRRRKWS